MKKNYSAPKMEQVRMEAEMPVMAGSAPQQGGDGGTTTP